MEKAIETAVFGGGCFWCTESIYSQLKGVINVTSGYAGGVTVKPSYLQVCGGATGHAEVIKVEYDPGIISYADLLDVFFHSHDPTTLNRQGNDVGDQYRSIILYTSDAQRLEAEKFIAGLKAGKEFDRPITTEIKPLIEFYAAEDYHQRYFENNAGQPYCQMIIAPKLAKFKAKFKDSIKSA
jgi:peptide-methionine (S)-S-oxide reductase